jgi:hypothetical protein
MRSTHFGREAADRVYERLQDIADLLAQVRKEVEAVVGNADLRAVLQGEQTWLAQAERTVAEVRAWREREAQRFWPAVARRWALALIFALASAWSAGPNAVFTFVHLSDIHFFDRDHRTPTERVQKPAHDVGALPVSAGIKWWHHEQSGDENARAVARGSGTS